MGTETGGRHRRAWVLGAVLAVAALLPAACGTRLTDEEIEAGARTVVVDEGGTGSGTPTAAGSSAVTTPDTVATAGVDPSTGSGSGNVATGPVTTVAPAQGAPSGAPGASCTGKEKPIVIGTVGQQTGVAGAAVGDGPRGVAAWAAEQNAHGGLRCHKIRYIILDDGGDPSRNQALTQQLVEGEGAIAIVQSDAPLSLQGSRAYLEQHKIPVVGSEGGSDAFYAIPTFFPQAPSGKTLAEATARGIADMATADQRQNVAIIACIENPTCHQVGEYAGAAGLRVVYEAQASLTSLDFTSQCNAAKQAGAKLLILGMDPNSINRIGASCRAVNFSPLYAGSSTVVIPSLANDPNLEGLIVPGQAKPWMLGGDPAVAAFQAALKRYAPGVTPSPAALSGWTSAKLFEAAAAALGDQPTSADVLKGLYAIRDNDLGGLTYPITFTAGRPATRVTCWYRVQVKARTFVSPDGGARRCR
jgi:ABC-type branched-subunit amino acid transport system substrate-binding protein